MSIRYKPLFSMYRYGSYIESDETAWLLLPYHSLNVVGALACSCPGLGNRSAVQKTVEVIRRSLSLLSDVDAYQEANVVVVEISMVDG
jgi:hypothetical protein